MLQVLVREIARFTWRPHRVGHNLVPWFAAKVTKGLTGGDGNKWFAERRKEIMAKYSSSVGTDNDTPNLLRSVAQPDVQPDNGNAVQTDKETPNLVRNVPSLNPTMTTLTYATACKTLFSPTMNDSTAQTNKGTPNVVQNVAQPDKGDIRDCWWSGQYS